MTTPLWIIPAALAFLCLALLAGTLYYRRKIVAVERDNPELARRAAIKERTKTSYRRVD